MNKNEWEKLRHFPESREPRKDVLDRQHHRCGKNVIVRYFRASAEETIVYFCQWCNKPVPENGLVSKEA